MVPLNETQRGNASCRNCDTQVTRKIAATFARASSWMRRQVIAARN